MLVVPPMPDILTTLVFATTLIFTRTVIVATTVPVLAVLDVSPSPDLAVAVDLLPTLGLAPTLHVSSALTPLCLGHAHRRLSPRMLELVDGTSTTLGAPRTPTRLGGQ